MGSMGRMEKGANGLVRRTVANKRAKDSKESTHRPPKEASPGQLAVGRHRRGGEVWHMISA